MTDAKMKQILTNIKDMLETSQPTLISEYIDGILDIFESIPECAKFYLYSEKYGSFFINNATLKLQTTNKDDANWFLAESIRTMAEGIYPEERDRHIFVSTYKVYPCRSSNEGNANA